VSLLLSLVFRTVARTAHERLAVDALRFLRGPDAEAWSDLLLLNHLEYLAGSEAPETRFQDFRNHVRHVGEKPWGDAPQEARRWYDRLIDAARRRQWADAAFAAGTLSHYASEPFFPLNTACTEEGFKLQAALEWSIRRSYGRLQQIIEHDQGGYPNIETPQRDDWLERMIETGAELAHEHYDAVLQHYELDRALRDPAAGMDQECQDRLAQCLAHAVVAFARILERGLAEAQVEAPPVETTLTGFLVTVAAPLRFGVHHWRDLSERLTIQAMQDEARRTGKVIQNLRAAEREVRRLHAEEVLRVPLYQLDQQPAALTGTLYGTGCQERYHTSRLITAPVVAGDGDVPPVWREAQRRVQQRTGVRPAEVRITTFPDRPAN
jgi:hypothetical protein